MVNGLNVNAGPGIVGGGANRTNQMYDYRRLQSWGRGPEPPGSKGNPRPLGRGGGQSKRGCASRASRSVDPARTPSSTTTHAEAT